jgi:hypothetical protein
MRRTKAALIYKKTGNCVLFSCYSDIRSSKAPFAISESRSTTLSAFRNRSSSENHITAVLFERPRSSRGNPRPEVPAPPCRRFRARTELRCDRRDGRRPAGRAKTPTLSRRRLSSLLAAGEGRA